MAGRNGDGRSAISPDLQDSRPGVRRVCPGINTVAIAGAAPSSDAGSTDVGGRRPQAVLGLSDVVVLSGKQQFNAALGHSQSIVDPAATSVPRPVTQPVRPEVRQELRPEVRPPRPAAVAVEREGEESSEFLLRRAALWETFFYHCRQTLVRDALQGAARAQAEAFLQRRGFEPDAWHGLPLGLVPDLAVLKNRLTSAGFRWAEINASRLLADRRLPGRLIGPIRGRWGQIESYWAWQFSDVGPRCLFLRRGWRQRVPLYGLDHALMPVSGGQEELLVVEDLFDALLLRSLGLNNTAAICGTGHEIDSLAWEQLAAEGVRRVTLAPGVSRESQAGLWAAVEANFAAARAPELFILTAERLEQYGSLVELARHWPTESVQALILQRRVPAYRSKVLPLAPQTEPWEEAVSEGTPLDRRPVSREWDRPVATVMPAYDVASATVVESQRVELPPVAPQPPAPQRFVEPILRREPVVAEAPECRLPVTVLPQVIGDDERQKVAPRPARPVVAPPPALTPLATTVAPPIPPMPAAEEIRPVRVSQPHRPGYRPHWDCRLHACGETDCFCFD